MNEVIELAFESPDGIVDCRLERCKDRAEVSYSTTILCPNTVNGFTRSEIYCCNLLQGADKRYCLFEAGEEEIPTKIKMLESQISKAIAEYLNKA